MLITLISIPAADARHQEETTQVAASLAWLRETPPIKDESREESRFLSTQKAKLISTLARYRDALAAMLTS